MQKNDRCENPNSSAVFQGWIGSSFVNLNDSITGNATVIVDVDGDSTIRIRITANKKNIGIKTIPHAGVSEN